MLEHSPLGASSAERWMNCPGSVRLINLLQTGEPQVEDDPDWRRDGVQAHDLAALCLNDRIDTWEAVDTERFSELTPDMMDAVQTHLNYVRSRPGAKLVELRMHRPEFHDMMYGTTDAAVLDPERLEVIDYKHGIGIVVEVENNPQIMYYAYMIIDELGSAWHDDAPITLTIVQPRVTWREPIRSWQTTVGHIRQWATDTLLPAMVRVTTDAYLDTGDHCRFCPAKLICPAMLAVGSRVAGIADVKALSEPVLAELLTKVPVLKMLTKALTEEAKRRMITERGKLPGWKVVQAIADRVWKDTAPVADTYGFKPQEPLSPAAVEKLEGGKEFVAEWAFRPNAGYDIVPETDRRKPILMETSTEKWQSFLDNMKDKA